jgi:hypothetical protein
MQIRKRARHRRKPRVCACTAPFLKKDTGPGGILTALNGFALAIGALPMLETARISSDALVRTGV